MSRYADDNDDDNDDRLSREQSSERRSRPLSVNRGTNDEEEDRPLGKMGKLSQEARLKEIRTASWIMLVVGIVTILFNIFGFLKDSNDIASAPINAVQKEALNRLILLIYGGFIGVGVLFVAFAFMVKSYPVPITIAALVVYLAGHAITAAFVPESIAQGLIIKIIIIVALVKSIQAAIAYSREESRSAE